MIFKKKSTIILLALIIVLVIPGCQTKISQESSNESQVVEKETVYEADVIVIGAGNAGLAAAVSAAESGASVIVLEKMPMVGGNSVRSGGVYNAVHPEKQKQQNIEDSEELFYQHTMEGGDNKGNPALVSTLVKNALDGLQWLESYGLKFENTVTQAPGALWVRSHQPKEPAGGNGVVSTLKKAADDLNVDIRLETKAIELLTDDSGKVIGVKAETVGKDKKEIEYKAKKGVVVATGGFGAGVDIRTRYNPNLTAEIPTTNHPGATGDGIVMMEKLNAEFIDMDIIQIHPLALPSTGGLEGGARYMAGIENIILVNGEGNRFIAEDARRDTLTSALFEHLKKTGVVYEINDSQIVEEKNQWGQSVEDLIEKGIIIKAETLADLEKALNIPDGNLQKTIADYNLAVENKKDSELNRELFDKKIEVGPFFAVSRVPSVHYTIGGVKINENTEVLDKEGNVIKGLFAAGEVTGGVHGGNRLGGNGVTDTIVFGRIAGKNASK